VIAMRDAGERIADALVAAGGARPPTVKSLDDALRLVDERVDGVLLLSPAATSYGEFDDYRARGEALRRILAERGMTPN
jgi:UDP-N-acetylmuramoylalanine--D-glutamate ligase